MLATPEDYSHMPRKHRHANALNALLYFTGKPCKYGHLCPRYASSGECVECRREKDAKQTASGKKAEYQRKVNAKATASGTRAEYKRNRRQNDPEFAEQERARERERRLRPEVRAKATAKSRAKWQDPEYRAKSNAKVAAWRAANPEKASAHNRANYSTPRGKAVHRAHGAVRRTRKLDATPDNLTEADWLKVVAVYEAAAELTLTTGIPHEVDHTCPLLGVDVSPEQRGEVFGLHYAPNLAPMTKAENRAKHNRVNLVALDQMIFAECVAKGLARTR
jgi:hypothetical protein